MQQNIYKKIGFSLSYTLPILVVSGVLFSIGFLFDPPFGAYLIDVGVYAFYMSYAVLAAAIAYSIGNRVALVPALIGGFMLKDGSVGLLGAVVIGFFVGYLTKALMSLFTNIPKTLSGILPVFVYPVIVTAMTLGLSFLMNHYLSTPLTDMYMFLFYDHQWLIISFSVILASLMAFDLGGPINKIAYLIAIMTLADGMTSTVIAAVIAGGMVPPLAVSVIQLWRQKGHHKQWWMTGIMGLCFMSEGAITYVSQDQKVIRPLMMIGSGVAGGLVGWFGISTRIPHGGVFITLFMKNWYLFLFSLLIGIIITIILLLIFHKTIKQHLEVKKTQKEPLQA